MTKPTPTTSYVSCCLCSATVLVGQSANDVILMDAAVLCSTCKTRIVNLPDFTAKPQRANWLTRLLGETA